MRALRGPEGAGVPDATSAEGFGAEDFAGSFAEPAPGKFAFSSVAAGGVSSASVATSSFNSSGALESPVRSISFTAGVNPICETWTRKWPSGKPGSSNLPFSSVQLTQALLVELCTRRNVAPGTGAPSGERTIPARRHSAGAAASGLCCAASEIPETAINQNSTASLLPSTSHAQSSPKQIPFYRNRSSTICIRGYLTILLARFSAWWFRRCHSLKGYPGGGHPVSDRVCRRGRNLRETDTPTICYTFRRYP